MLSIPHLVIIFLVALVVLGPEKLPQVARVLGKTMADFRRITNDFRMQIEDEMRDLERRQHEREIATALAGANPSAALPPAVPTFESLEPHSQTAETGPSAAAPAVPAEKPADGEPHAA